MGSVPVCFEPGTRWLYGYGHDILSGLITLLSGKPTSQFMRENIFEPLGMTTTDYRFHDGNEKKMSRLYQMKDDGTCVETDGLGDAMLKPDQIYDGGGAGLKKSHRRKGSSPPSIRVPDGEAQLPLWMICFRFMAATLTGPGSIMTTAAPIL